jgi:ABC-type sugar transport system substrate-binding protein
MHVPTRKARIGLVGFSVALVAAGVSSSRSPSAVAQDTPAQSVAAAQAATLKNENLKAVTLNQTPLKSKPPSGALIVGIFSTPALPIEQGAVAAAKAAGWKETSMSYDPANPSTVISDLQTALQFKPFAVIVQGESYQYWSRVVPAYAAAHVQLIPVDLVSYVPSSVVQTSIQSARDTKASALVIANWFIAASKGRGKALATNVPSVANEAALWLDFRSDVKKQCPGCTVNTLALTGTQFDSGTAQAIVSALQANPSLKYVINMYGGGLTGLPAALSAANIKGITVGGYSPLALQLQEMKQGTMPGAWNASGQAVQGWLAVDSALRIKEGMNVQPGDGGLPQALLTPSNIGTVTNNSEELPLNYVQEFETLWHVA